MKTACEQCPWRRSNQGKPSRGGFFRKDNLRRLWNQIRGASSGSDGGRQSCHLTDPSHLDHIEAGAKPGAKPRECPGSLIVVTRELKKLSDEHGVVTPESVDAYLARRKNGITKRGMRYWLIQRIHMALPPPFGDGPIPGDLAIDDPEIGLPTGLEDG